VLGPISILLVRTTRPIVLNELVESRYGLSKADRRDFALLFGDPWWLVKTILSH
jgi:hypothetical protein